MATMQTWIISVLAAFTIFTFGAIIFTQAVSNGGYTDQYPMNSAVSSFNNSSATFVKNFANATQSMTNTQTNTNPTDGNPFSLAGQAIGLIWDLVTSSVNMAVSAIMSISMFVPSSLIGIAIIYLGVIFTFAIFAYILRWFV